MSLQVAKKPVPNLHVVVPPPPPPVAKTPEERRQARADRLTEIYTSIAITLFLFACVTAGVLALYDAYRGDKIDDTKAELQRAWRSIGQHPTSDPATIVNRMNPRIAVTRDNGKIILEESTVNGRKVVASGKIGRAEPIMIVTKDEQ